MTTPKQIKNKEIIKKLTDSWYDRVAINHHKDRDCHWYINTVYSYGKLPVYRVEHYGYIHEDISEVYSSYKEAEESLIEILKEALKNE